MASVGTGLRVLALILTVKRKCRLEFYTGLGLALQPLREPARGPAGPGSTDNIRLQDGFGPDPNYSNQKFFKYFGILQAILFQQRKMNS
jgi:hypothetical protein